MESMLNANMADAVRLAYRTAFNQALAAGRASPLLVPYSLLGPFIVPTLWLAIPHVQRPWLYSTRWLVMLFVIVFNLSLARNTSSTNMAGAYASGLMLAWGIVSNANLILWKRPQFDSARVIRRRRQGARVGNGSASTTDDREGKAQANGFAKTDGAVQRRPVKSEAPVPHDPVDGEYELVWEPFPADASFGHRLNWAVDLVCSFRGSGWTHSISAIPRPQIPSQLSEGASVSLDSMPKVTANGYGRCLSEHELVRTRVCTAVTCYLILDFLAVFMVKDPYFNFGPSHPYPLPSYLQGLSPGLLSAYRQVFGLVGVYCAIDGLFNLHDLIQYYLGRQLFPRNAELCFHASTFGSFSAVLDRGLAAWWGSWWHQTFRMQFLAPTLFLQRHGYIRKGSVAGALLGTLFAFAQSGFLHAMGSATSIPPTKIWRAPAFFLLQGVGIVLQQSLSLLVRRYLPPMPKILCRVVNLAAALGWLYLTADLFLDDLASCGLWLFEPVPVSVFRALGFGHPGDHWWRWDQEQFPKWYSGLPWWKMGVAI